MSRKAGSDFAYSKQVKNLVVILLTLLLIVGHSCSCIVKWGYQDNFKPVYLFFFLRKDFERTKSTKTENKRPSCSLHAHVYAHA